LQGTILTILRLDRLARLFDQRPNSGFDFAVTLSRFQALAMSFYSRGVDYQRIPPIRFVGYVTSATAGVNVEGNPTMNTTVASAAHDDLREGSRLYGLVQAAEGTFKSIHHKIAALCR
jgi:hypothetical protein